jgi:hypothetical protein
MKYDIKCNMYRWKERGKHCSWLWSRVSIQKPCSLGKVRNCMSFMASAATLAFSRPTWIRTLSTGIHRYKCSRLPSCLSQKTELFTHSAVQSTSSNPISVIVLKKNTKLHGLSARANYTDRATAACRRSDCQLLRIEGATWSAWQIPTAVFSVFWTGAATFLSSSSLAVLTRLSAPRSRPTTFFFW